MKFTLDELERCYDDMTTKIVCDCQFSTHMAGGLPADEDGIRMFVKHHLGIKDPIEIKKAVKRHLEEEIGEKNIPTEEGELKERISYGINVIRSNRGLPYLGNWMIHACLKSAASRLKIFTTHKRSKGNFAEAGQVSASGVSISEDGCGDKIYLMSPDGSSPAKTVYREFKGSVGTPQGRKSIVHNSECVEPGTRFGFEFRFLRGDVPDEKLKEMLALSMKIGLGSVKSLGCGKFRILEAEIVKAVKPPVAKTREKKEKK